MRAWLSRLIDARIAAHADALVARAKDETRYAALREFQVFGPPDRLTLAPGVQVNDALFNTVSGSITVEADAFFGHGVAILTGTHDVAQTGAARATAIPDAGRDVVVGAGAWIASRATVLGPCVIGRDAVVCAGAVVTADVAAGAIVGGVPARVVRRPLQ